MDRYRQSRKSMRKKDQAVKLQGLSPQKYGKAAYEDVLYTPSKLADNILFKDVSNLKKYEQVSQKYRDLQQAYSLLNDKYEKIRKEKIGMEESLSTQIQMYKKLIEQMEENAQRRLKQAQQNVKKGIQSIVREKQEEIKFVQAEKEELENQVAELEEIGNKLQANLNKNQQKLAQALLTNQQMSKQMDKIKKKLEIAEEKCFAATQKNQNQIDQLRKKATQAESIWRDKMDAAMKDKDNQFKLRQKQFKEEVKQLNRQRDIQKFQRKHEMKNLAETFEKESIRLNNIILQKQQNLILLNQRLKQEAQIGNYSKRGYEDEITVLAQEKNRVFQEFDELSQENARLNLLISSLNIRFNEQKRKYEAVISDLKKDLNFSKDNFYRERERNSFSQKKNSKNQKNTCLMNKSIDNSRQKQKQIKILRKEIDCLTEENVKLRQMIRQNEMKNTQNQRLRIALRQSAFQVEKCKQEFIKLGKQRDLLEIRLQEESCQNATLRKIKKERESEAKTWKDSYIISSSRRR